MLGIGFFVSKEAQRELTRNLIISDFPKPGAIVRQGSQPKIDSNSKKILKPILRDRILKLEPNIVTDCTRRAAEVILGFEALQRRSVNIMNTPDEVTKGHFTVLLPELKAEYIESEIIKALPSGQINKPEYLAAIKSALSRQGIEPIGCRCITVMPSNEACEDSIRILETKNMDCFKIDPVSAQLTIVDANSFIEKKLNNFVRKRYAGVFDIRSN